MMCKFNFKFGRNLWFQENSDMKFNKLGWKEAWIAAKNRVPSYSFLQVGRWLIFLVALCLMALTAERAVANAAESVSLVAFYGVPQVDGVALFWSTATELNSAGFRLTRTNNYITVPLDTLGPNGDGFIPAIGSPTLGADYTVVDDTAVPDTTYTYTLIEISLNAGEVVLASIDVTAGVPPTYTPIPPPPTIAIQPTSLPSAVQTAVPTHTPVPTEIAPTETAVLPTHTPSPPLPTAAPALMHAAADVQPVLVTQAEPQPAAIAQVQVTPENGYPAPEPTAAPTAGEESYPAPVIIPTEANPTAYPVNTQPVNGFAPTATPFNVIGADDTVPLSDNAPANSAETDLSSSSIAYLWLGFLVALLIFGTAVIGSILLFVRRQR
jgi:hypothetical protein